MANKQRTLERIVTETDRKSAQKLRGLVLKALSKDKKSDDMHFFYLYSPFRKQANFLLEGNKKTVAACLKVFGKFGKATEKKQAQKAKKAEKKANQKPKYYTRKK